MSYPKIIERPICCLVPKTMASFGEKKDDVPKIREGATMGLPWHWLLEIASAQQGLKHRKDSFLSINEILPSFLQT